MSGLGRNSSSRSHEVARIRSMFVGSIPIRWAIFTGLAGVERVAPVCEHLVDHVDFVKTAGVARVPTSPWKCRGSLSLAGRNHFLCRGCSNSIRCYGGAATSPSGRVSTDKSSRSRERENRVITTFPSGRVSAGKRGNGDERNRLEQLWSDLFANPSSWWDNRLGKPNERFPDFKHKQSGEGLWLDRGRNPAWVASRINSIAPGVSVCSEPRSLSGYNKAGQYKKTMEHYKQMRQRGVIADAYVFVHVLNACAALEFLEEGRLVHKHIIQAGCELNPYVGSALVDMYTKCGSIVDAQCVFDRMETRDVVCWTAMIMGFVKCGQALEALDLFRDMELAGVEPNPTTFLALLNAYASLAALKGGRRVHEQIVQNGCESDIYLGCALVDMYAKCGSIQEAQKVFDTLPDRNVVAWNSMILGFAMHGHAKQAVALFEQMSRSGSEMDEGTFVCLLSACSHGGLVKEGKEYFGLMQSVYGVSPSQKHFTCMVDILGRAGYLDDAEVLVKSMPFEPSVGVWMALLSACRIHGNVEMGERAAKQVLRLDNPENSAGYVLLSNIYAGAGQFDRKNMIHSQRLERRAWKLPGRTWIEVDGKVHTFVVHDRSHPQIPEILAKLENLSDQMTNAGYVPDTRFALQSGLDEDKLESLCGHSEKLAIAFGLISTPAGAPFCIVKNLRVCGDCHTATKFISKICGREITVRDANRFHHVKDGHCSCGDYW